MQHSDPNDPLDLKTKFPKKEITLRLLSAAVLLAFGVLVNWVGGSLYAAVVLGLAAILAWEYVRLWRPYNFYREYAVMLVGFALTCGVFYMANAGYQLVLVLGVASILWAISKTRWMAIGFIVLSWFLYFGLAFRASDLLGISAIVVLCSTAWGGDTGAYVAGRIFGGAQLAPLISPRKTWSGFWGAIVGAMFFVTLMALILQVEVSPMLWIWAGFNACIGVVGDLAESWMKRIARVKDTSDLIPGHGGLLDRLDGLIAVLLANGAFFTLFYGQQDLPEHVFAFLRLL